MQKVFLPCPFGALPDGGPVRQSAFSSQNFFLEPLEHGGHLRSGCQSSGVQNAFALALDGLAVGFGAGMVASNLLQIILCALLMDMVLIRLGCYLGNRLAARFSCNLSWLGGALLILLAFLKWI